jgi:hypothetical protein
LIFRDLNKKRQVVKFWIFKKQKKNCDENLQLGELLSEKKRKEKLLFLGNFIIFGNINNNISYI